MRNGDYILYICLSASSSHLLATKSPHAERNSVPSACSDLTASLPSVTSGEVGSALQLLAFASRRVARHRAQS